MYILYVGEYLSYIGCCQYMYVNTLYICISLHLQNIIRFFGACIYYVSDRACLHSNSYVHSCLNNFIRILKWYFVFICLVFSYHDFISDVEIVIDSCGDSRIISFSICLCLRWRMCLQFYNYWLGGSCLAQKIIGTDFFV